MTFQYDENKSKKNFLKHGIDFETAKLLWNDINAVIINAKTVDEPRKVIIAQYQEKMR